MIFVLLIYWAFGLMYAACCIGCFVEGVKMFLKGNTPTEKIVGALVALLGVAGLYILF